VIVSAEVGIAKPSPDIFALTCEAIGSAAARTAMIGDNWESDVVGARSVGLMTIFVRTGAPDDRAERQKAALDETPILDRFTDLAGLPRAQ
jgi:FMN phosphatase YigB (HAD superfamily)